MNRYPTLLSFIVWAAVSMMSTEAVISSTFLQNLTYTDARYLFPMLLLQTKTNVPYIGSDENNCQYKDPSGSRITNNKTEGFAEWNFTTTSTTRTAFVVNMHSPDSLSDSMFVRFNKSRTSILWNLGRFANLGWGPLQSDVGDQCFKLPVGTHQMQFFIREPGAGVRDLQIRSVDALAVKNTSVCTATSMCAPGIEAVVDITLDNYCGPAHFTDISVTAGGVACTNLTSLSTTTVRCRVHANVTTMERVPLVVRDDVNQAMTYLYFLPVPVVVSSSTVDVGLIAGVTIGVVVALALPVAWYFYMAHRKVGRLLDNEKVACELAESIARMEFDDVAYLDEIESPNRIQKAFKDIVSVLKTYKSYMPKSLFAQQQDDEEDEGNEALVGMQSECDTGSKYSTDGSPKTPGDRRASRFSDKSGGTVKQRRSLHKHVSSNSKSSKQKVVVLALNLRSTHKFQDPANLPKYIETTMTLCTNHVAKSRGVPILYYADRLLVGYNAVTRCASKCSNACSAMMGISREVGTERVAVGAAAGNAICGDMGTSDMKAFAVVGHVVNDAVLMQQYHVKYGGHGILHDSMYSESTSDYIVGVKEVLPGSLTVILELVRGKDDTGDNEWMYDVKDVGPEFNEAIISMTSMRNPTFGAAFLQKHDSPEGTNDVSLEFMITVVKNCCDLVQAELKAGRLV